MKRSLSSIGLHSFQGIWALPQMHLCVNHVSGKIPAKLILDQPENTWLRYVSRESRS